MGKKPKAEKRLLAGKYVGKESDSDKRGGKRARRVHLDTNISSKPNTEKKPNGEGNKEKAALEILTGMFVTYCEVKRTKCVAE
ncbi:Polyadenylate-binding protein RBP47B', partial [Zea mays]